MDIILCNWTQFQSEAEKMKLRNFPECRVKGKRERKYERHEEEILKSQKERIQRTQRTIF